jgi:hypothetical protein
MNANFKNHSIVSHPEFENCGGRLLCELIGGSKLYGLDTPESDIDYRGLFFASNKQYIVGFEDIKSIVQTEKVDSVYYELIHYLNLLRSSNTQALEILFAPRDSFSTRTFAFEQIYLNRFNLINSEFLKSSLKGYIFNEMRLATGERTGKLGGKRKAQLDKYGFSPKNFVQIIRLCKVGQIFFTTGQYVVNVKDSDASLHEELMDIKTQPQKYTIEQLKNRVAKEYDVLVQIMDKSDVNYKFDIDLASDIIILARNIDH